MPKPMADGAPRTSRRLVIELLLGALVLRWRRYEIADRSMHPTLQSGDWVLGLKGHRRPRVGDIVVCDLPGQPGFAITKRVAAIDPTNGDLWLLADNHSSSSVDSRTFGTVPGSAVEARLVLRYRPLPLRLLPGRRRSIPS